MHGCLKVVSMNVVSVSGQSGGGQCECGQWV